MRRALLFVITGTLCLLGGAAAAQDWPNKPVRMVVAYAAGGANDLLGRVFAEQLGKSFGQQFFVENRTGGSGLIGTEAVARAAPDGYTLQVSGMPSHVLAPAMNKNASFDPIKDFTHLAYLGGPPNVFVVHESLGVNSFKDLLALMKRQTDGVQYVSPAIGSVGNMVAEYVADKEKVRLSHVVYRGGGQAIQDLVAGHVKVGSMTLSTTKPHIADRQAQGDRDLERTAAARLPRPADAGGARLSGARRHHLVFAFGPGGPAARHRRADQRRREQGDGFARGEEAPGDRHDPDQGDDAGRDDGVHAARGQPVGAGGATHRRNQIVSIAGTITEKHSMVRFLIAFAAAFIAGACAVAPASAQTYPQRAVKFILPFGPAAGVDITARLLADKLSTRWGKPVVVENRPGGDGLVAINAFTSANDDHTLLFVPASTYTAHPYTKDKVPYDAERDLLPIVNVTIIVIALSVPESAERQDARRVRRAGARQARHAQRRGRRRQLRPDPDGFHQDTRTCRSLGCPTATSSRRRTIWPRRASIS